MVAHAPVPGGHGCPAADSNPTRSAAAVPPSAGQRWCSSHPSPPWRPPSTRPDLYDVEYGTRFAVSAPAGPRPPAGRCSSSVGSSRTVMAFAPEQLPPLPTAAGADRPAVQLRSHRGRPGPKPDAMSPGYWPTAFARSGCSWKLMPNFVSRRGNVLHLATHTAARDIPVMHDHMPLAPALWRLCHEAAMACPEIPRRTFIRQVAPDLRPAAG